MSDSAAERVRNAACSCGALSIEVRGEPAFQAICACRECQGRTGSAFGMSIYYDEAQVIARKGAATTFRRMSNKDRWLDFRFCPVCGTTVWWDAEFVPGKVGVAGVLFEDGEFTPDGAYFCASKPEWVRFDESIPVAQAGSSRSD